MRLLTTHHKEQYSQSVYELMNYMTDNYQPAEANSSAVAKDEEHNQVQSDYDLSSIF
jgi:hypothetical protein